MKQTTRNIISSTRRMRVYLHGQNKSRKVQAIALKRLQAKHGKKSVREMYNK